MHIIKSKQQQYETMQETKFSAVQHIQLARNLTQLKSALCSTTSPVKSWKHIISKMGLCQKNTFFQSTLCRMVSLLENIENFTVYLQELALRPRTHDPQHPMWGPQIKYFWGEYQKNSLSHTLEFPTIMRLFLCDLLSRSDHLCLINFTFLEVSQIWAVMPYIQSSSEDI